MKKISQAVRASLRISSVNTLGVTVSIAFLASAFYPTALFASPLLRCQIDQGGDAKVLDFVPVSDPYPVKAIDINGRFRFKAVVMGDAQHIEYIKVYVYSQSKRQPILLHLAKYMAPVASSDKSSAALTGINYVYSPQLERELQYGCALLEKTS